MRKTNFQIINLDRFNKIKQGLQTTIKLPILITMTYLFLFLIESNHGLAANLSAGKFSTYIFNPAYLPQSTQLNAGERYSISYVKGRNATQFFIPGFDNMITDSSVLINTIRPVRVGEKGTTLTKVINSEAIPRNIVIVRNSQGNAETVTLNAGTYTGKQAFDTKNDGYRIVYDNKGAIQKMDIQTGGYENTLHLERTSDKAYQLNFDSVANIGVGAMKIESPPSLGNNTIKIHANQRTVVPNSEIKSLGINLPENYKLSHFNFLANHTKNEYSLTLVLINDKKGKETIVLKWRNQSIKRPPLDLEPVQPSFLGVP